MAIGRSSKQSVSVTTPDGGRIPGSARTTNLQTLLASIDATPSLHSGGKLVLFTSTHTGEGKTTVVTELVQYVLTREHHRVLVIDGGRRHDLSNRLVSSSVKAIEIDRLLTDVTATQTDLSVKLVVAVVNPETLNAEEPLLSAEKAKMLASRFGYVFIELPSVIDAPRAILSTKHTDGVIMVIEAGATRWPAIQHAREQVEHAGHSVIGAFLNKRTFVIPPKVYAWL